MLNAFTMGCLSVGGTVVQWVTLMPESINQKHCVCGTGLLGAGREVEYGLGGGVSVDWVYTAHHMGCTSAPS